MQKIKNKYQLAKCHINTHQKSIQRQKIGPQETIFLHQYQFQDDENQNKNEINNQFNIFKQNVYQRMRKLDIQKEKPYQYVGVKEIKDYIVKIHRKKKNFTHNQSQKISNLSVTQMSLQNSKVALKNTFATKNQLIRNLAKFNNINSVDQTYITVQSYDVTPNHLKMNQKGIFIQNKQNFSLKKIKKNLEKYMQSWKNQETSRQNISIGPKFNKGHVKHNSSLINDSKNYRKTLQKQIYNSSQQHMNNINPRQWDFILRKDSDLISLKKRQLEHICSNGWKINGNDKLKRQIDWIRVKDNQGCFFKRQNMEQGNKIYH